MSRREIIVLKFGSSVLADRESLPTVVQEIYRHIRRGKRVVAVVSAMGDTTDRLLAEAREMAGEAGDHAIASLLRTGETRSVAWLTLALDRAGIPASALSPEQIGLRAAGSPLDSRPVDLDEDCVLQSLERRPVAVVPGFVGCGEDGSSALFGRGGSDMTALFLAQRLGAKCRMIKDVEGIYDRDPAQEPADAQLYSSISWKDALEKSRGVVQQKALLFAGTHEVEFEVACPGSSSATLVGAMPSVLADPLPKKRPLRVGLLGLGTVGSGVYEMVSARADDFEIVGIVVRDPAKHASRGVPKGLLSTSPDRLLASQPDVIIELMGGVDQARSWVESALDLGVHVITANKMLIALRGDDLHERAVRSGAQLRYSASVGGSLPLVELTRMLAAQESEAAQVASLEGVLNGTTNFVLDQMRSGQLPLEAVKEAQRRGFAEADPSADLEGGDAAAKIEILARELLLRDVPIEWRSKGGITELLDEDGMARIERETKEGRLPRLVASADLRSGVCVLNVELQFLAADHPLAQPVGEENRLLVQLRDGRRIVVDGKGAGRWPTTESVLGDLFQLHRSLKEGIASRIASAG